MDKGERQRPRDPEVQSRTRDDRGHEVTRGKNISRCPIAVSGDSHRKHAPQRSRMSEKAAARSSGRAAAFVSSRLRGKS